MTIAYWKETLSVETWLWNDQGLLALGFHFLLKLLPIFKVLISFLKITRFHFILILRITFWTEFISMSTYLIIVIAILGCMFLMSWFFIYFWPIKLGIQLWVAPIKDDLKLNLPSHHPLINLFVKLSKTYE
jgi:hypothetical protein